MNIKTHTFRGHRYKIVESPSMSGGICEAPWADSKEILIPVGGSDRDDLDTTVHEGIHACFWDMDEEAVTEAATDIARLLWRLGWRKD